MFIPKPSKNKKLKARVLSKLYAEEAKERKDKRVKRITIRPRQHHTGISVGISNFLRKSSERKREERIQKARIVQKIRESNLPEPVKQQEQSKVGVPIYHS